MCLNSTFTTSPILIAICTPYLPISLAFVPPRVCTPHAIIRFFTVPKFMVPIPFVESILRIPLWIYGRERIICFMGSQKPTQTHTHMHEELRPEGAPVKQKKRSQKGLFVFGHVFCGRANIFRTSLSNFRFLSPVTHVTCSACVCLFKKAQKIMKSMNDMI